MLSWWSDKRNADCQACNGGDFAKSTQRNLHRPQQQVQLHATWRLLEGTVLYIKQLN